MVGTLSVVGSPIVDSHSSPCSCLDAVLPSSNMHQTSIARKHFRRPGTLELSSSFVDSWHDWRLSAKALSSNVSRCSKKQRKVRRLMIVSELAGQYEDSFEDVKRQILNYFTYKAVRTVLNQLYEMNPTKYRWFYEPYVVNTIPSDSSSFVVTNKPGDGKHFIRNLGKEKHELAERVMVTRLHLYGKWIKKCDHAAMYNEISDENLELMRERLIETVIWPSDDTNIEKIG